MPATVALPERAPPSLDATLTTIDPEPLPLPDAPIQVAWLDAVHAQPVLVVTRTVAEPPATSYDMALGVTLYVQVGGGGGSGAVVPRNADTVAAVPRSARALSWLLVPVTRPP